MGYGYDITSFCFEGDLVACVSLQIEPEFILKERPLHTSFNLKLAELPVNRGVQLPKLFSTCVPLTYNAIRQSWYHFILDGYNL